MRVVALTGNVAAGKSTVARRLVARGAVLIDADAIVRELQRPGTAVHDAIVGRFGRDILQADGTLDRPALRAVVLADREARADLEAIVHPAVERERRRRLADAAAGGAAVVIADIPLLFEAADPLAYDGVILVDAPEATRRARLIRDRGLDPSEADRLIAAQMPSHEKRARATWILDNEGDIAALEAATDRLWDELTA
jgi:dephospho-CoA kinase